MRANYELCLSGTNVILVPYRPEHVPTYHEWMKDAKLLELTSSEPLTYEEEANMQIEWRDDENKCTFVILARDLLVLNRDGDDDADVNDGCAFPPPPHEVEDGEEGTDRWSYPSLMGDTMHAMIGDVNLFLSDVDDDDDEVANSSPGTSPCDRNDPTSMARRRRRKRQSEIDVMIALPTHRHRDLGSEIALMVMHYASSNLNVSRFYAKIHETNVSSLRLFECKLGYSRCGYAKCFGEYELECDMERPDMLVTYIEGRWRERLSTRRSAGEKGGGTTSYIEDDRGGILDDDDAEGFDEGNLDGDDDVGRRSRRDCHRRIYNVFDCPL
jgi:RimJ/RimL family protein N-acetyltransferase